MSQENVELLHRWRESWARQDVDAAVACLHTDVEIDFSAARGPFRGVYLGRAEAVGMWRSVWEAWGEVGIDFAEVVDCGDGRLITVNVFRGEGRTSGIRTEARVANLWHVRDGFIHRVQMFQSKDKALEAVGLAE
ncbi:MAG TPA: nuclear transport factor 2 family protein [Thermoleophilaceae bacterium]|nr:nuclear transport factor 2 family protein [Thermoleophilaceae bacterium]